MKKHYMGKIICPTGESVEVPCETELVSDGYHDFKTLYDHRITLFIALCRTCRNLKYRQTGDDGGRDTRQIAWRSKTHSDGSVMDGWFVLGIGKEKGAQITYHLPISRWDETDFAETLPTAPEWDGHTSQDVLERLKNL